MNQASTPSSSSSAVQTLPLRINSPIIACYPWQSSILEATSLDKTLDLSCMKHFLERLTKFETHLSTASWGDGLDLRNFFDFQRTYLHLSPELRKEHGEVLMAALKPKLRSAVVGLLLSYRIVDVAAVHEGLPTLPLKHRHSVAFGKDLQHFERLENWPTLLRTFKDVDKIHPTSVAQNPGTPGYLRHVKVLSEIVRTRGKASAFVNIQIAVMGLHRMLTETEFDISETPKILALHDLSEEERETLARFFGNSDKLDLPVRLAFMISPLYLLIPKLLHKSRYDHQPLAMVAKSLGNQRPALLARVEKELFSSLFRLATEKLDIFREVKECMSRMPWEEIGAMGDGVDCFWFKSGDPSTLSLRTADVEGEIPLGWAVSRIQPSPVSPCGSTSLGSHPDAEGTGSSMAAMSYHRTATGTKLLLPPPAVHQDKRPDFASVSQGTQSAANDPDAMAVDDQVNASGIETPTQQRDSSDDAEHCRMDVDKVDVGNLGHPMAVDRCENDGEDGGPDNGFKGTKPHLPKLALRLPAQAVASSESRQTIGDWGEGDEDDEDSSYEESSGEDSSGEKSSDEDSSDRDSSDEDVSDEGGGDEDGSGEEGEDGDRGEEKGEDRAVPSSSTDKISRPLQPPKPCLPKVTLRVPAQKGTASDNSGKDGVGKAVSSSRSLRPSKPSNPGAISTAVVSKGKRKQAPSLSQRDSKKKAMKAPNPLRPAAMDGSTLHTAIDVDELFVEGLETNLDADDLAEKHFGPKIIGYSPSGAPFEFTPSIHTKEDLLRLHDFDEAIRAGFVDGLPLHVADPANSAFCVMTAADFKEKSVADVQTILQKKHILITGMDGEVLEFNARGLASLAGLSTITTIQDQSIPLDEETMNFQDRVRMGTLRDLLACSKGGKVLNALDFPMPEQGMGSHPFSTDSAAWNGTKGAANCDRTKAPPLADIRWGIAATAGALHWWHVDCEGFGTYVDTKAGLKWWIIARRKGKNHAFESYGEVRRFLNSFEPTDPNEDMWDLEAVVLHPGTRLIMRPNTPHAVFTPQDAICHGGHFYASTTMQDTLFGIVHTFICDVFLTNASHTEASRLLFCRIAAFYHNALVTRRIQDDEYDLGHIPSLADIPSVLNLFTFCNAVILMNVLDIRTYGIADKGSQQDVSAHDLNAIPIVERYQMAHARGRCMDILRWFFSVYEIYSAETGFPVDGYKDVAMAHLARQASAIRLYKQKAIQQEVPQEWHCTLKGLDDQLALCFKKYPEALQAKAKVDRLPEVSKSRSLDWPNPEMYGVRKIEHPIPHRSPDNFLEAGTTAADAKLFRLYKSHR